MSWWRSNHKERLKGLIAITVVVCNFGFITTSGRAAKPPGSPSYLTGPVSDGSGALSYSACPAGFIVKSGFTDEAFLSAISRLAENPELGRVSDDCLSDAKLNRHLVLEDKNYNVSRHEFAFSRQALLPSIKQPLIFRIRTALDKTGESVYLVIQNDRISCRPVAPPQKAYKMAALIVAPLREVMRDDDADKFSRRSEAEKSSNGQRTPQSDPGLLPTEALTEAKIRTSIGSFDVLNFNANQHDFFREAHCGPGNFYAAYRQPPSGGENSINWDPWYQAIASHLYKTWCAQPASVAGKVIVRVTVSKHGLLPEPALGFSPADDSDAPACWSSTLKLVDDIYSRVIQLPPELLRFPPGSQRQWVHFQIAFTCSTDTSNGYKVTIPKDVEYPEIESQISFPERLP